MAAKAPPDRGRFESENPFDSLGEEEAGEKIIKTVKKQPKRVKFSPWEHSPTLFENGPKPHEGKYIVIETTSGTKLTEMSLFTVEAVLKQIAPGYISADQMRDGKILLLTKDQKTAKQALAMTQVNGICQIKVTEHNDLNQVKGTVYSEDLMKENLEELKEKLKSEKVVDVRRVTKMENGAPTNTPLHILTFESKSLEPSVKIGWKVLPLRKYYSSPLKCTKCLILGHTKKNCKETVEYCRGCALPRHEGNCTRKACRNCPTAEKPHSSNNECPKIIAEKAIIEIKEDLKIPYFKARLEFQKRVDKAAKTAETQAHIQQQQEMYRNKTFAQVATNASHDAVQQQILKTLEILQRKIENLEKNQIEKKTVPKRKKRPSSESATNSSADESEIELIKPQQQQSEPEKTNNNQKNNIHNNNDDFFTLDGETVSGISSTRMATTNSTNTQNMEYINLDYDSKEITGPFESIAQQTNATLIQSSKPQTRQQQQQITAGQKQKTDTVMDFEVDNKYLKRPITAQQPVHKTMPNDGKKKKTPKN